MEDTGASLTGGIALNVIGLALTALGSRNLEVSLIGNRPGRVVPIDINPVTINNWKIPLSASLMGVGGGLTYAGCEIYAKDKYKNDGSNDKDDKVKKLALGLTETTVGSVLLSSNIIKMLYEVRFNRDFDYTYLFLKNLALVSVIQGSFILTSKDDIAYSKVFIFPGAMCSIALMFTSGLYLLDQNVDIAEKALLLSGLAGSVMIIDGAVKIGAS